MEQHVLSTKRKNSCQPRIQYPEKVSFKYKAEMNNSSIIQKLKEFITSRFTQQEMLKEEGRRRGIFFKQEKNDNRQKYGFTLEMVTT